MINNSRFWNLHKEVNGLLKRAFIQMPGGMPEGDPNAQGGAPMDPNAQGGAPMGPSMMQGGMPMDPSMMQGGAPMDPSMMQGGMPMDPSMMQGGAPMDPSMMGGMPAGMPAGAPPPAPGEVAPSTPSSPIISISLDQLFEIIQKVLGLAKKVGANGSGLQAQPEQQGLTQDQLKATIYEALGGMN